jgi:signal peptidase I
MVFPCATAWALAAPGGILRSVCEGYEKMARAGDSVALSEKRAERADGRLASLYDLCDVLVASVIVIAVLFLFLFRFAGVVGTSMIETLQNKDWLLVSAVLPEPKNSDIVIIAQPNEWNEPLVKRVIAVAGQTVDIRSEHVYVDGEMIDEPYLIPDMPTYMASEGGAAMQFPALVPEGHVFCLGDNRTGSMDSRFSEVGYVRNDYILGKVLLRLYPHTGGVA